LRQRPWPATGGGVDSLAPAFPARCAFNRGRPSRWPPRGVPRVSPGSTGRPPVLASDIPVRQFHLTGSRPTGTTSCRSHPSMCSARARNCMTTASRATGATSAALATPQPPSLIGRVVCTHAASDMGVPTTASHVARWVAVNSAAKTAALGRTTSLKGGWMLSSGAVIGGCWVGMRASPAHLTRVCQFPWGPSRRAGRLVYPPCVPTCVGSGSVSIGATGGSRGASPVSPCMSLCTGSGSVAIGATGGCRGAGPSEGGSACARASELDCAASSGWKIVRRVAAGGPSRRGGAWLWTGW